MSFINPNKKHLALIGYRGTGKSTIGKLLKSYIDFPFYDSDNEIVRSEEKSIPEIFKDFGEEYFRKLEEKHLKKLLFKDKPIILSTGGGIILSPNNRNLLKEKALVILLSADEETIFNRIANDPNRPPLTSLNLKEEIHEILSFRTPLYQDCMDFELKTENKEPEEILLDLLKLLDSYYQYYSK